MLESADEPEGEELTEDKNQGPWMLIVTTGGMGKRVPVGQFRLQNRGGMGIIATKFRKKGDTLAALTMVNEGQELMVVTQRGIIIRTLINAISAQSRPATGVRLQRLDESDGISAVAVVPISGESGELDEIGEGEELLEIGAIEPGETVEIEAVEVEAEVDADADDDDSPDF